MMKEKFMILKFIIVCLTLASCGKSQDSGTTSAPMADNAAMVGSFTSEIPAPVPSGIYLNQIKDLAAGSACANYSWKNRSRAPLGYIKGMTLSFARSLCRLKSSDKKVFSIAAAMSVANSNNTSNDALAYYQNNFANIGIDNNVAGEEPLRAVYVLGMGLGMRESSGMYCEGWDKSAGSARTSSEAEAGLFQVSYNSISTSIDLLKLYSEYQSNSGDRCLLNVFKEGANCSSSTILGTGAGADYQVFNKACPAFATEYAMMLLRVARSHWGPINRMEAEVVPACDQLLQNVQDLVNSDTQNICQDIF
jgi:hypothetical protein